jgi:signal transduction histidine kinase
MSEIFDPARPNVLMVDDIEANLVALEALLDPLKCNLVRARSGNEGLKQLLRREFAVILLDVQMPEMDGYEMARLAHSHPSSRETPIIFLTANNMSEDTLLQGYGSGAVDVLFKPVSPVILRGKVQVFLDLFNAHRRLEDEIQTHKSTLAQLQASRDELAIRHEALERAQQDQRELTEFIVHDLKNPLTVVNAGLELVAELVPDASSDLGQTVSEAAEATRRLRTMVEDLLAISRMEQSDFPLQREAVSLTKLLRAVIQAYVRRAQERGITLAPPPELSLEIKADRTLLQRVLENILDNAFRYTPANGRIAVTTTRSSHGVEINVSNDGPPIPERERHRVFEKFRRGARDGTSFGNAGLGLYFCKRAMEAHGGGIDIIQLPDWPTSFRLSLPA